MAFDSRTPKSKAADDTLRAALYDRLTDPEETADTLLSLQIALEHTVSDFRKDRTALKSGHKKPVNIHGPGLGDGGGGGGGGGGGTGVTTTVTVAPTSFAVTPGATAQLTATVRDNVGTVLVKTVTWSSTNAGIASVDSSGLVTGVAPGPVTIRATVDGVTGSATGSVTPPAVASVSVAPSSFTVRALETQQLTATVRDSGDSTLTGRVVTWQSSNTAVATVSSSGLVTGVAAGSATITATAEGVSGTAAATVTVPSTPTITSVTVAPNAFTVTAGQTRQLTATAKDASGNTVSTTFQWSSGNPPVATVSGSGLVTAVLAGTATISATAGGVTGTSAATVNAVPVASVTVSPNTFSKTVGQTQQLVATTRDANGNILTGRVVTWSSSNSAVASVSSSGLVTALASGSATITATCEGQSGTSSGTISAAPPAAVATVSVSPSSFTKSVGSTQLLTATVRDSGGNILTGRVVTWASNHTNIATVTTPGQTATVTAVDAGSATITATCETVTGTSAATITLVPVAQVTIAPTTFTAAIGGTVTLTATTKDASGNTLTGRTIAWSSSNTNVATVTTPGATSTLTGVAAGPVTVTATSEGVQGTTAGQVAAGSVSGTESTSAPLYTLPTGLTYNGMTDEIDGHVVSIDLPWTLGTPPGTLRTATDQSSFTTALAAAVAGDEIVVTAGITLTPFDLPVLSGFDANDATKRAIIRTSAVASLPALSDAGTTVSSADAANMFNVVHTSSGDSRPCIRSASAAKGWRIIGAKCTTTKATNYEDALVRFRPDADGDGAHTSHMGLDRCWLVGGANGTRRGVEVGADSVFVHQTRVENIDDGGTDDSNAVATNEGVAKIRVTRNVLEAVSENIIFGGGGSSLTSKNPTDIEIRGNLITKKVSWSGVPEVKNHIEFKKGVRALIEGNRFLNDYDRAQDQSLIFQSNSQNNAEPAALSQDITVRYNRFENVFSFCKLGYKNGTNATTGANRIELAHNLVVSVNAGNGNNCVTFQPEVLCQNIAYHHNTTCNTHSIFYLSNGPIPNGSTNWGVRYTDNIAFAPTAYGVFGPDGIGNETSLNTSYLNSGNWTLRGNVAVAGDRPFSSALLAQPNYTAATVGAIGFTNLAGGDYSLGASSPYRSAGTDGKAPGVNTARLSAVLNPAVTTCAIVTSTATIATSSFAKPGYLTPTTEPDFGTSITRITGAPGDAIATAGGTWPNAAGNEYAKIQPWSADGAYAYVRGLEGNFGTTSTLILDGNTYAPIVQRVMPGTESRWNPAVADQMVYVAANGSVGHWNPITNVSALDFTTSSYSGATMGNFEGNPSADGRYVAVLATRTSDSKVVVYVVDRQLGTKRADIDIAAAGVTDLDWASVSQGGGYVLLHGVISGVTQGTKVYTNAATPSLVSFWNTDPLGHFDLGIDGSGNEVAFGAASGGTYSKRFLVRRLDTGVITPISPAVSFNWHASCRNYNRHGWGYATTNDATGSYLDSTMYAIKMDGTQIERLARHRTTGSGVASAVGCPSPDGKRVMFRSNWGDVSERPVQGYVCDVRGICP